MDRSDIYTEGESWKTGSQGKYDRMEAYLEWLMTPEAERAPKTKKAFAAKLDVTVQTLANYEKDLWFQRELNKRSRGLFKATKMLDVISSMVTIATNPENRNAVSAARLLLDWQDKIVEHEKIDLAGISTAKLLEMINSGTEA